MCGIVGIVDLAGKKPIDPDVLRRMNDTHARRGPDGSGLHVEPGVGLGHRRLSIIDLEGGKQPLFNEDHTVVVVFNGEIYNFQELTAQLVRAGHVFRTRSDTEVIVHAWEEWGAECVKRFRGMFAFAVWDRNCETLFLARDRFGKKPLYYRHLPDGTLIFGSELKSLRMYPQLSWRIDPTAIEDFFAYGYVPDPKCVFDGTRKLEPGHTLTLRRGRPAAAPVQYWNLHFAAEGRPYDEARLADELVARLREAIEMRLIAEVPLGAFLSGGVDSSGVVSLMAGLSERPVKTCSIAFRDPKYDETRYARRVAERYGTDHNVDEVDVDDFGLIDALSPLYDEPFADSSALPTYRVCELARRHVTVALSGDGGDETVAGYRRYRWHLREERIRNLLPLGLRRQLFGMLGRLYPKADWAPRYLRAKSTFQALARDSVEGYANSVAVVPAQVRAGMFTTSFQRELQGYTALEVMKRHYADSPKGDAVGTVQYLDVKTYLPGDILTKVDRASMAHGLEVRVPFLDHPFVEWLATLPPSMKIRDDGGKYILKKALQPYVDDDILYRRKMGFAVPLSAWFRGPLRERIAAEVASGPLADSGVLDKAALERLVRQHAAGTRDNSSALWALLVFSGFLRNETGQAQNRRAA